MTRLPFFVLLLLILPLKEGLTFTLNTSGAAAFDADNVKINVASHTCPGVTETPEEILELAMRGVNQFWNKAPTSRLKLSRGSVTSVSTVFQTEPICETNCTTTCPTSLPSGCTQVCPNPTTKVSSDILISCNTNAIDFCNTSVLGVALPNNTSGIDVKGALVLINGSAGSQWSDLSEDEKVGVLAHEIGHALGLGHSPVKDSLMYYTSIPNRSRLGWDDIDGIGYLYPALQPFGLNCSSAGFLPPRPPKGGNGKGGGGKGIGPGNSPSAGTFFVIMALGFGFAVLLGRVLTPIISRLFPKET